MKPKYALFSLFKKLGCEVFAKQLIDRGFTILSSGGTANYLSQKGIAVTDISEITGMGPILGHRVVTLVPEIHAGLLATEEMREELEVLGYPWIELVYINFYPLKQELNNPDSTFESCIEKTDIGGPTMVRSANKGRRIAITSAFRIPEVLEWLDAGEPDREHNVRRWAGMAEQEVADYINDSASVYMRFRCL